MIPTFVIFLREGVEASMIVAILLAYLDKIGQRRHFREIFIGVGAALLLALVGGVTIYLCIDSYNGSRTQTIFETATYLLGALVLTYMTFWMQRHSRLMTSELQQKSDAAIEGSSRFGIAAVAFTTVCRESLETMVFTLAIVFASSTQGPTPVNTRWLLFGALAGLVVALGLAFGMYKVGLKVNLKRFFQVLGLILMFFAAGLLVDAVQNMQGLGWLPFGQQVMWSSKSVVAESSSFGDALHSLIGYADQPTVLQAIVWIAYLAICLTAFYVKGRKRPPTAVPSTVPDSGVAGLS